MHNVTALIDKCQGSILLKNFQQLPMKLQYRVLVPSFKYRLINQPSENDTFSSSFQMV